MPDSEPPSTPPRLPSMTVDIITKSLSQPTRLLKPTQLAHHNKTRHHNSSRHAFTSHSLPSNTSSLLDYVFAPRRVYSFLLIATSTLAIRTLLLLSASRGLAWLALDLANDLLDFALDLVLDGWLALVVCSRSRFLGDAACSDFFACGFGGGSLLATACGLAAGLGRDHVGDAWGGFAVGAAGDCHCGRGWLGAGKGVSWVLAMVTEEYVCSVTWKSRQSLKSGVSVAR